MALVLLLLAIGLFVAGIVNVFERRYLVGALLIVLAVLVGPGGYNLFGY